MTFGLKKVKITMIKCIGGGALAIKFTPQQREETMDAIEKALNRGRTSEARVKIEDNKLVVFQIDQKIVSA